MNFSIVFFLLYHFQVLLIFFQCIFHFNFKHFTQNFLLILQSEIKRKIVFIRRRGGVCKKVFGRHIYISGQFWRKRPNFFWDSQNWMCLLVLIRRRQMAVVVGSCATANVSSVFRGKIVSTHYYGVSGAIGNKR